MRSRTLKVILFLVFLSVVMNHGTKPVLAVRQSSQPLLRVDQASNGGAASITVNPPSGQKGTHVMLSGMSLQAGDTSCTIISPSPQFVVGYRCSVGLGGYVTGSFTVGDVQPGVYIILVIGSQGNPTGDFAQATFNVVAAGSQASPQDNNPGSHSCPHGYTWTTSGCIPLGHPLSCPPNYYTNESGKCVPLPPSIP